MEVAALCVFVFTRLHLALRTFKELLETLQAMSNSRSSQVRNSAKVIQQNVFYMQEYRDLLPFLLKKFNNTRNSKWVWLTAYALYIYNLIFVRYLVVCLLSGTDSSSCSISSSSSSSSRLVVVVVLVVAVVAVVLVVEVAVAVVLVVEVAVVEVAVVLVLLVVVVVVVAVVLVLVVVVVVVLVLVITSYSLGCTPRTW